MSRRKGKPFKQPPTPGWLRFLDGQRDYADGALAPRRPTDSEANSDEAAYWYGWMIARSRDVARIFQILDMVGISNTKKGDAICAKLVDALDKKLGFVRE